MNASTFIAGGPVVSTAADHAETGRGNARRSAPAN